MRALATSRSPRHLSYSLALSSSSSSNASISTCIALACAVRSSTWALAAPLRVKTVVVVGLLDGGIACAGEATQQRMLRPAISAGATRSLAHLPTGASEADLCPQVR